MKEKVSVAVVVKDTRVARVHGFFPWVLYIPCLTLSQMGTFLWPDYLRVSGIGWAEQSCACEETTKDPAAGPRLPTSQ